MRLLAVVVVMLMTASPAFGSTRLDAIKVSWYLRGQTDALFSGRGWTVKSMTCTPRPDRWVDCRIRVAIVGRSDVCDRAFYRPAGHGIVSGYEAKPHACGAPQS